MRFKVGACVLYIGGEKLGSEGLPLLVSDVRPGGYDLKTESGAHFVGFTDADLVSDTPAQRRASATRVATLRQAAVANRAIRRARLAQIRIAQQDLDKRYRAADAALLRARQDLVVKRQADEEALAAERRALEIEDSQLDPQGLAASNRASTKPARSGQ